MKILITGGKGQLGTELFTCLENKKTEIGIPSILTEKNDVTSIDVDVLDITDLNQVEDYFKKHKFDCIINCAAYTNVDKCEEDLETAFKVNAIGPRNLAIAAEKIGAKLIHISTDYIFSGEGTQPFVEWDNPAPQSIYGKTKALGERYVSEFCSRYFIIRTAWLYGYYGNNFVKTIMRVAKEQGEIKVVDDQRGNPTNAADLAHHILKLAVTEEYGIYHGTGTGECSWYDFAVKIVEFAKINAKVKPCTTEEFPRPAKRPAYSSLENMMFKVTVGDDFRQWEVALKYFIENLEENLK